MLSSAWNQLSLELPRTAADVEEAKTQPTASRDKIRCLDGLRGIACLVVFNYHFFWPWTSAVMMGYGALPPRAPEPYSGWAQLPILCLLHRGRPMVAIFFAISGYVICRHILRAIREGRIDAAYRSLASAVFRRAFRLYIPPTISMLLVAVLAQTGLFRSEDAIYKGPDSIYINGTTTTTQFVPQCRNGSFSAHNPYDVAQHLGISSPLFLGNMSGWSGPLCLNSTSELFGPASLYTIPDDDEIPRSANETARQAKIGPKGYYTEDGLWHTPPFYSSTQMGTGYGPNLINSTEPVWIQFGGSWEEHPLIHDNLTLAVSNFTVAYAEWANPFHFMHYHTRYDPHTFTIPIELRGSMFLYLFFLGTAAMKTKWRLGFGALLSAYSLVIGRWDMATFLGGALLSEVDIWKTSGPAPPFLDRWISAPIVGSNATKAPSSAGRLVATFIALYLLSYPDSGPEYTPGFQILSHFVPKYYRPLAGWMFYQSMGALTLVYCILRSPTLSALLEGRIPQYFGRISFSFYLVHGPVLHSLGFWIMPRLFDYFGRTMGFAVGWVVLLSTTLYLSGWWYRKIDVWSMTVGKRIERVLLA